MPRTITHVTILEDDPYAANAMMFLLARDVRTRVLDYISFDFLRGQITTSGSDRYIKRLHKDSHIFVLNVDSEQGGKFSFELMDMLSKLPNSPRVVCTCKQPDRDILSALVKYPNFAGYVSKVEILFSLATVVRLADKGFHVFTRDVIPFVEKGMFSKKALITGITKFEEILARYSMNGKEILRLGLLLNLSQYEIHNELVLAESYIAQVMSQAYSDLLIPEIVSGETRLEDLFDSPYLDNKEIINHYTDLIRELPALLERRGDTTKTPKFRNMNTLAFHLCTVPDIKECS